MGKVGMAADPHTDDTGFSVTDPHSNGRIKRVLKNDNTLIYFHCITIVLPLYYSGIPKLKTAPRKTLRPL